MSNIRSDDAYNIVPIIKKQNIDIGLLFKFSKQLQYYNIIFFNGKFFWMCKLIYCTNEISYSIRYLAS